MNKILVTGALGQIGSELTLALREKFGVENVIASDKCAEINNPKLKDGPFECLDVTSLTAIKEICKKYEIDAIVHLAAILSGVGEKHPNLAWQVNMYGLHNILEVAREFNMNRVLVPSSIAAFGPSTPKFDVPQETILEPTTMYGVTKVAGELLCNYYVDKFGLDVRGLRYPGIISHDTLPGGGTTDYAVAIYYDAIKHGKYECFVKEDTMLPMMYMPDCLKATMDLFLADKECLKHHSNFNLAAMSFTVTDQVESIKKFIPEFECTYEPDFRQAIADSWPKSIDDTAAREEWGWKPEYDLDAMTEDMLKEVKIKVDKGLY
jgi:nucleoside-diphosphate-sugar epimerase